MIRINNIIKRIDDNTPIEEDVIKILHQSPEKITVIRRSVDARHKNDIKLVYSVGVHFSENEKEIAKKCGLDFIEEKTMEICETGKTPLPHRPVIAGFGPAGMFCGYILAKYGYNPIIIERGGDVDSRSEAVAEFWTNGRLDTENNVQFGEGGAGTFSDGKLTTRINDPLCSEVLKIFAENGAPDEILYMAKPHIGTDILKNVVKNIRQEIIRLGGEVRFFNKLEDIEVGDALKKIKVNGIWQDCRVLVIAIGHSARDTFEMLFGKKLEMIPKSFSVGARIEHIQAKLDEARYGKYAGHPLLRHAEYQLSYKTGGRCAYTFCMCPGGTVVAAASEEGGVVTNGMSEYSRDGENANSALVVDVHPSDFGKGPLDGMYFQRKLEQAAYTAGGRNYFAPMQTVGSFMYGKDTKGITPTCKPGTTFSDLTEILPKFITDTMKSGLAAFDKKIKGFADKNAVLTGVETRTSSPLRILRDETMQSIPGIYPAGEGAGYAGGIVSAAVDGIKIAHKIIEEYKK